MRGVVVCVSSRRRHTSCLSDWSSDVCSSDLFGLKPETQLAELAGIELRYDPVFRQWLPPPALCGRRWRDGWRSGSRQIGRASCRERVKAPVVAVTLKRNNSETSNEEPPTRHA